MRNDDLVVMGYVRGAFGVRGWVKIHVDTEYPDSLFEYPVWWLGKDGSWKPYTFENGTVQPKAIAAKLEGIEDRDGAELLRGMQVAVPRSEMPPPEDDEYYWSDLIGLDVFNQEGLHLGKVTSLMETGANDVLVVSGEAGNTLIPFVGQFVLQVLLEARRINVDWGIDY